MLTVFMCVGTAAAIVTYGVVLSLMIDKIRADSH